MKQQKAFYDGLESKVVFVDISKAFGVTRDLPRNYDRMVFLVIYENFVKAF